MATTLQGSINLAVALDLVKGLDIGEVSYPAKTGANYSFTNGTGANQANMVFVDTRTLAASAAEDLDLSGTALTDAFGTAIAFTAIKAIIVKAAAANTNDVQVGGDASAGIASIFGNVADFISVKPGGMFCVVAPNATGYALTATTADLLQITNSSSGTGVTYDIIIVGTV